MEQIKRAWGGWWLDGVVACVQILVSLLPSFVPLSKLFNLSVPHLQIGGPDNPMSPDQCDLKCISWCECSVWYQALVGCSLNQDVKGKKQPGGCLTSGFCLCVCFSSFWPHHEACGDLSSPSRYQTQAPCSGSMAS